MAKERTLNKRGTQRQKKLAKALIENAQLDKPLNAGQLLVSVGYAKNTAEAKPTEIIEQEGVKVELALLGFDEQNAKNVVGAILNKETAQDKDRLKAADMVFDVFGTKAPLKSIAIQVNIENKQQVEGIASKVLEQMKNEEIV